MHRNINILAEQRYEEPLGKYGHYFGEYIRRKGWNSLLYESEGEFFCRQIVHQFYENIQFDDIDLVNNHLEVKWGQDDQGRDIYHIVNPALISEIIGVPLSGSYNQNPLSIAEYMPLMGRDCRIYKGGGGIQASTVYRNVYAVGRWLKTNVVGDSHVSSFYREELHVIHMMMTRDPHFCICHQLFATIAKSASRVAKNQVTSFLLPCLVTKIASTWIDRDEYYSLTRYDQVDLKSCRVTSSYGSAVQIDWTPAVHVEDVPVASSSHSGTSSSTGSSVFRQYRELPDDPRERENILYKSNRAVFKAIRKLMCGMGPKQKKDEATSEPRSDPLHEEPTRVQPLRRCSRRGPGIVIEEQDETGGSGHMSD